MADFMPAIHDFEFAALKTWMARTSPAMTRKLISGIKDPMRYAVVIEKANGNYSAYVPDLPGCVATGKTVAAVEEEIRIAIRFHIEGLKTDGLEIPAPTSIADYVEA